MRVPVDDACEGIRRALPQCRRLPVRATSARRAGCSGAEASDDDEARRALSRAAPRARAEDRAVHSESRPRKYCAQPAAACTRAAPPRPRFSPRLLHLPSRPRWRRPPPHAMNLFRLLGDLSHLASIFILVHKIQKTRSVRGVSFKTQLLYLIVFLTRSVSPPETALAPPHPSCTVLMCPRLTRESRPQLCRPPHRPAHLALQHRHEALFHWQQRLRRLPHEGQVPVSRTFHAPVLSQAVERAPPCSPLAAQSTTG